MGKWAAPAAGVNGGRPGPRRRLDGEPAGNKPPQLTKFLYRPMVPPVIHMRRVAVKFNFEPKPPGVVYSLSPAKA